MTLRDRIVALREAVPELMRRCVADVSDKNSIKGAFAICTASLQKSRRVKKGTHKLTDKGKSVSGTKAKQRGAKAKHRKYVKALQQEMQALKEVVGNYARNAGFADTVVSLPEPSASRRLVQQFEPVAKQFGDYLSRKTGMVWEFDKNIGASGPGEVEFGFVIDNDDGRKPHFGYNVDYDPLDDSYTLTSKLISHSGKVIKAVTQNDLPMEVVWRPETAFDKLLAALRSSEG